jgi:nucleotide-binding universal stress UspA family protein
VRVHIETRLSFRNYNELKYSGIMKKTKMTKVLIALDYDPKAEIVAETGFSLAESMGAEVTLLHVIADANYYSTLEYNPITGFMGFDDIDVSHLMDVDGLKKATTHFLDKVKHHLGDDTIKTLVKEGDFAESILKAAKDVHADIIVMGSHGRRWLDEILMGSVTEKVLHHTSTPLFIVPIKNQK